MKRDLLPTLAALAVLGADAPLPPPAPRARVPLEGPDMNRAHVRGLAERAQRERKMLVISGQRIPPAAMLELLDATEPPGPALDAAALKRLVEDCRSKERESAVPVWTAPSLPTFSKSSVTPVTPGCDAAVRDADAKRRRKAERLEATASKGGIRRAQS